VEEGQADEGRLQLMLNSERNPNPNPNPNLNPNPNPNPNPSPNPNPNRNPNPNPNPSPNPSPGLTRRADSAAEHGRHARPRLRGRHRGLVHLHPPELRPHL